MTGVKIDDLLRKAAFFQGMSQSSLVQIAKVAELVEFSANQTIFRQGDAACDIFIISSGNVTLEICSPGQGCRQVLSLGDGDLLGWSSILGRPRLTATARAMSDTLAMRIPADQMIQLCERDAEFGYQFMRRTAAALATRLSSARIQFLDVYES